MSSGARVCGGRVAHQHLTTARGVFQPDDSGSCWSQRGHHPMGGRVSRQHEMNWTRLHTSRGTQPDPADRRGGASRVARSPLHPHRRAGSAAVVRPVEEQQQRVAAPREKVGAFVLGNGQQPAEHGVERLLSSSAPSPAPAGQPLGERREAGDVEHQQASIDNAIHGARLCGPGGLQPGQVRQGDWTVPRRGQLDPASDHSSQ